LTADQFIFIEIIMKYEDMVNRKQFSQLLALGLVPRCHDLSGFGDRTYGEPATSLIAAMHSEDSLESDCENWGFSAFVWRQKIVELLEEMMQEAVDDEFGVIDALTGYGDDDLIIGLREYPDGSFDAFYQDNGAACMFEASADDWNQIVEDLPNGVTSENSLLVAALLAHFHERKWIPEGRNTGST